MTYAKVVAVASNRATIITTATDALMSMAIAFSLR
jgi:hypothetical protein